MPIEQFGTLDSSLGLMGEQTDPSGLLWQALDWHITQQRPG
jgi:hypothetical protein